ncbi:MAG: hypothetical protein QOH57_1740 [Mycobacterium sp.]|jgi:hypothetical protein|nr:hypothetical protein [Mycobacterium sp.]
MDNEPRLVRPYTLTAGRTRASISLPLEAQVELTEPSARHNWLPNDVRAEIVKFCATRPSVAEVAAKLDLPVGVARVLVGDLVEGGHLRMLSTLDDTAPVDERRELIGRTLRGLRTL